ncbi:FG-GAP-like repeat-containing protein [Pseudactinotalea suaedae]|uniref:FG-GAP-like repeat-containing protein n=1 Tax=Pseudactinotalea suaedae TaxID=1524924 RepID=UPI0012E221B7|nr:FG-GAP-like repeat-containing protein [Pseudactinotalea suaedae]
MTPPRLLGQRLFVRAAAAAFVGVLITAGMSAPSDATPTEPPTQEQVTEEGTPEPSPTPTSTPTADPGGEPTTEPAPEPTDPAEPGEETTEPDAVVVDEGASTDRTEVTTTQVGPQSLTVMAVPLLVSPLQPGVYRMTSPQGPRCAPTVNASLAHMGQDLAAPLGTPIYAIAAGTVKTAKPNAAAGQWIVIEHVIDGKIITSSYSHSRNATEFVRAGDRVVAGQRIATVASTGVSTGPHLHLELWQGRYGEAAGGKVLNPDTWLAARGVSLRAGAISVSQPKAPASCTYWAQGNTSLRAAPSSTAAVVTTVRSGTVLTTPGAGVKTNAFIQVTTPNGVQAWAPASQVSPQRVAAAPVPSHVLHRDYTGDTFSDVLAVDASGALRLYAGNGAGGWSASRVVGSGWKTFRILAANDANGDGKADIFGIDAAGRLHLYPGRGNGSFGTRLSFGPGWSSMAQVFSPGDFDGDGRSDVVAVDTSGRLWLYKGNGKGGFQSGRTQIGHGWGAFTQVLAGGDVNRDGRPDILGVDRSGRMFAYLGNGSGRFAGARQQVGTGWANLRVHSVGGFDADGLDDYLTIAPNGAMYLYRGSAKAWVQSQQKIGQGWFSMRLA